jgi:hypothetical protein
VKRSTSSSIIKESAQLNWTTLTETNNFGFEILREFMSADSTQTQHESTIGFVEGAGFSTSPTHYQFIDNDIQEAGTYSYQIKQLDFDGDFSLFGPFEFKSEVPERFGLYQNYPNPFNPTTTIRYDIAETAPVSLEIYSILGQKVRTLVNQSQSPGRYSVTFDATGLGSGIYLYRLRSNGISISKKLLLIK